MLCPSSIWLKHSVVRGLLASIVMLASGLASAQMAFTEKLAQGERVLDFRQGVPGPLADRGFERGFMTVLSNPYVPDDRRLVMETRALACHPAGGVMLWARLAKFDASKPPGERYFDAELGAWRLEADGRLTPFAVRPAANSRGEVLCNTSVDKVFLPDWSNVSSMVVEPNGDLLLAQSWHQAVFRIRRNGWVEAVAGGGDDLCRRYPHNSGKRGYRDGPAAQALFNGEMKLALASDGSLFIGETQRLSYCGTGNCTLRRLGVDGQVSTVFGTGRCPDAAEERANANTSVDINTFALDKNDLPLVQGLSRGPAAQPQSNGRRPDGVFSKAFRIGADGQPDMIGFLLIGYNGKPQGRFDAIGLAPDGAPVALAQTVDDKTGKDATGLLALGKPTTVLRYWWKAPAASATPGAPVQSSYLGASSFCSATDGSVFLMNKHSLLRLEPKTQRLTTWLQ